METSWGPRNVLWNQAGFEAWANATKRRYLVLMGVALALLAAACIFAVAVMGPRLVREGNLLWFGTYTQGVIENSTVRRVGTFKGGDPKYELTIDYSFTDHTGAIHHGRTLRGDVRTPPDFAPGDAAGVFYDKADPRNSVAEHNLRTDVYALLLFLPFLVIVGLGSTLMYLIGVVRWACRRAPRTPPATGAAKTPYVRDQTVKRASRP